MNTRTIQHRKNKFFLTVLLALAFSMSGVESADGQITARGALGAIEFRSGLPPTYDRPFLTTPAPWRPLPLFLAADHATGVGRANGFTDISIAANGSQYWVNVRTDSWLDQQQYYTHLPQGEASFFLWGDAIFDIGPRGLPAHLAVISYPLAVRNGPGNGSYTVFDAQLTYVFRPQGGQPINLGFVLAQWRDFRPGAAYNVNVREYNPLRIPNLGPGELYVYARMRVGKRHRPPGSFGSPGAGGGGGLEVEPIDENLCEQAEMNDRGTEGDLPEMGMTPCQPVEDDVPEREFPEDMILGFKLWDFETFKFPTDDEQRMENESSP